jgi:glutathione S-transferase
MTAIDFYLACMVHWKPQEDWFKAETPTLWRAAEAVRALPQVAEAYKRNFG